MSTESAGTLREEVRRRYAEAALAAAAGRAATCGGSSSCCAEETASGDFGASGYTSEQRGDLPDAAALASLGCGNPTAVAELNDGDVVLDLGSGGGIDVILSAQRVGPTRRAERITSIPPPEPRSRTVSPSCKSATAVGLPQPSDASAAASGNSPRCPAS